MKIVVFGPASRLGVLVEQRVLDVAAAARSAGRPQDAEQMFGSLLALIESGDRGLDGVSGLIDRLGSSDDPDLVVDVANTRLHAPFPGRRLALAGGNFASHVANIFSNRGTPTSVEEARATARQGLPQGFWVVSPPVGHDAEVPLPGGVDHAETLFDYEGELAVILKKGGKRLRAEEFGGQVWGTTLVIDWSLRPGTGLAGARPFYGHKIFDASTSMGPWISVGEVDPADCSIETRVNGELRQKFSSREMTHSYGELLEQMSADLTLLPGDVLAGGTGPGTAIDSTAATDDGPGSLDLYLDAGDTVEVSSPRLGRLAGHVVPGV